MREREFGTLARIGKTIIEIRKPETEFGGSRMLNAKTSIIAALALIVMMGFQLTASAEPTFTRSLREEVIRKAKRVEDRAKKFHTECKNVTGLARFLGDVQTFQGNVRRLYRLIENGFSYQNCKPHFKRLLDEFTQLQQTFNRNYSNHPNWEVVDGWHHIEFDYVQLEYTFTTGQLLGL